VIDSPNAALIYPPLTDPTSGYHSLNYLDSYARSVGHRPATVIDANIEAFHHSYTPSALAWLDQALSRARATADLGERAHLLQAGTPDPEGIRDAVATFQDPERFYDLDAYHRAVDGVSAWMNCLGAAGYPGQFENGFQLHAPREIEVGSLRALTDPAVLSRLSRPFLPYYQESLLPRLRRGNFDLIGISITYQWQLPFALWLAHLIRQEMPDVFLITGGTEVSDCYKNLREPRRLFELFSDFDGLVVGEGESAYTEILDALGAGTLPTKHPNVRLHPKYGAVRALPMLHYEKLGELPTPDFGNLPWDSYLSPTRFVYYSPTRGCYWNKCTFCDYGLNTDGPTSPWRQDTVDRMIRDVEQLSTFAQFVYFSVDVLAPAAILRFAEKVVERGIDVRWGAEIRLEKYWSDERCELLKRAGCTAISVGFESGNQRILDLIDKGTRPAQVRQTMASMHRAGIGVQIMGFTGFPTETLQEARDSVSFLRDNRDLWTFGGLGEFVLTPGAIVAKQPDRFGITGIRPFEGADINRSLLFDEPITERARDQVLADKLGLYMGEYPRPWVSSTDTPHTFFYHDRYGTGVRDLLERSVRRGPEDEEREFVVDGELLTDPDPEVLARLAEIQGNTPEDPAGRVAFRRADGRVLLLPRRTLPFLRIFTGPVTLADARRRAWMLPEPAADRIWDYLIARRVIRRVPITAAPGDSKHTCNAPMPGRAAA
jgi:anaerobic magnesium-protoporphyrin IX monomethyl ester cyclase